MPQTIVRARYRALATATLAAAALLAVSSAAWSQQVAVFVDGVPITELDITHRQKFIEMSTHKMPGRQEAIDSLIDETLEIREAKRYTIEPATSDVDDAYSRRRVQYGRGRAEADANPGERRRK